ncbi:hypothetical protein [Streptomyces virginiae]|uniref:hypothetical protein n=1 Tax=Streptomyces virginiae TaxID=1961 RepID=UPI0022577017|nr:hypothetical protein [Streptomyces virginiae]MCX5278297.1 hypothetical protein [Streptomyces virginiae]
MAKNHAKHHETKRAAERLLTERYGDDADPRYGGTLPPEKAIVSVLVALGGHARRARGQEPEEVPAEDVLAALTQVDEVRKRLDGQELRLIKAARDRGASWQKVADALGLGTRQSAETRALRLERGAQTYRGRDVASQRLDKARDRVGDAWCSEQAERIRDVGERLFDTIDAWSLDGDDKILARTNFHVLGSQLAADGNPQALFGTLQSIQFNLSPYGKEEPKPTGKHAAAAGRARTDLLQLTAESAAVRQQVTSARGEDRP